MTLGNWGFFSQSLCKFPSRTISVRCLKTLTCFHSSVVGSLLTYRTDIRHRLGTTYISDEGGSQCLHWFSEIAGRPNRCLSFTEVLDTGGVISVVFGNERATHHLWRFCYETNNISFLLVPALYTEIYQVSSSDIVPYSSDRNARNMLCNTHELHPSTEDHVCQKILRIFKVG